MQCREWVYLLDLWFNSCKIPLTHPLHKSSHPNSENFELIFNFWIHSWYNFMAEEQTASCFDSNRQLKTWTMIDVQVRLFHLELFLNDLKSKVVHDKTSKIASLDSVVGYLSKDQTIRVQHFNILYCSIKLCSCWLKRV